MPVPPHLNYYLYISDAKGDMLYEQIHTTAQKQAFEWKVSLKLASLGGKSEDTPHVGKYQKLKVILRELESSCSVGSVDEPRSYFKGTMALSWGNFRLGGDFVYFNEEEP